MLSVYLFQVIKSNILLVFLVFKLLGNFFLIGLGILPFVFAFETLNYILKKNINEGYYPQIKMGL